MIRVIFILALLLLVGCQGYKMENGQWSLIGYDEGVGRRVTVIEGADEASFKPVSREYAKDKKHAYLGTQVIAGADPVTFIPLEWSYSKDKQKVFWREREISGAEPDSFQIIDGRDLLSKDRRDFYFGQTPLGVLDMGSFQRINQGWSKDAKAYYTTPHFSKAGRVDCDFPSMKILSDHYAVDRNRAYYYGKPMLGVDVETFRVTGLGEARDKYKNYNGDREDWRR